MKKIKEIEKEMIRLVNKERSDRGLKTLNVSEKLCYIARLHSKVQLQHRDIFHESPIDGSNPGKRIERGEYLFKACAENVSTAPTLSMNHNGLMKSPGHYKNIVGNWAEIGIGIEEDVDGQLYITQLFANPVNLINTEMLKASVLDKLRRFRASKNLGVVSSIPSGQLQLMAESQNDEIQSELFDKALQDARKYGTLYSKARIFQFSGFSNPGQEEQMQMASRPDLKGVGLAFHQDRTNGRMKGVFLFLM